MASMIQRKKLKGVMKRQRAVERKENALRKRRALAAARGGNPDARPVLSASGVSPHSSGGARFVHATKKRRRS